eukprot:2930662-Rhodomonas_salina.5
MHAGGHAEGDGRCVSCEVIAQPPAHLRADAHALRRPKLAQQRCRQAPERCLCTSLAELLRSPLPLASRLLLPLGARRLADAMESPHPLVAQAWVLLHRARHELQHVRVRLHMLQLPLHAICPRARREEGHPDHDAEGLEAQVDDRLVLLVRRHRAHHCLARPRLQHCPHGAVPVPQKACQRRQPMPLQPERGVGALLWHIAVPRAAVR